MLPPLMAKSLSLLVCLDWVICPFVYYGSIFTIHGCFFWCCFSFRFNFVWEVFFSSFAYMHWLLMQLYFSFFGSNVIFTKLSFLTGERLAGDSEKSVFFRVSQFSELWRCYQTVTLFSRILCECSWIFQAFCWIGGCPVFNCILNFICFVLSLFWVFLPFCQVCSRRKIFVPPLLMSFLNFRQQFHINSGVIFFFAVKTFSTFFSVQLFLKVFTPIWVYCWLHFNLTSFLIATWCLFRIFCIFQVVYFLRCQGKYWSGI